MKISEVTDLLESLAPISSQESYDNSGLIVGDKNTEVTSCLISLDCTEAIIDEAIAKGCNLIISHHPIVFKGLKKLTGNTYVERVIIKAIKHTISIYAIHTNLDNFQFGVNKKIGDKLGIKTPTILAPVKDKLSKVITYIPKNKFEDVRSAVFQAGAGNIGNYTHCSFSSEGLGTFEGNEHSNPVYGEPEILRIQSEVKLEVLVSNHQLSSVVSALIKAHPYEEVAYDIIPLKNANHYEGAGMIGELEKAQTETDFLRFLKETFKCQVIRHTDLSGNPIKRVAWCGGAGSFLLENAKREQADIFITGDFKYHEFFDADNEILIADIGHFESEQFTIELIAEIITKKFPTFALCLTEISTNPVKYY